MLRLETWRSVVGYEGLYKVSNRGRVKSITRLVKRKKETQRVPGKIMALGLHTGGYLIVNLSKDGRRSYPFVHRLVAEVFIRNPKNKPQVNHKDANKQNNSTVNLEWVTQEENTKHAVEAGLYSDPFSAAPQIGELNNSAKLTLAEVQAIKKALKKPYRGLQIELAKKYGVTEALISAIKLGKAWP